mgnify:CR=1 FL=1
MITHEVAGCTVFAIDDRLRNGLVLSEGEEPRRRLVVGAEQLTHGFRVGPRCLQLCAAGLVQAEQVQVAVRAAVGLADEGAVAHAGNELVEPRVVL